jgi:hypothetical protein
MQKSTILKLMLVFGVIGIVAGYFVSHRNKVISCTDPNCQAASNHKLACALTSQEQKERKATVIAGLQKEMLEKKETKDGYAFKFKGTDAMVDELSSFIKSERECCSFFTFHLSVAGDKSSAWLELSGPEGAKGFIKTELGL